MAGDHAADMAAKRESQTIGTSLAVQEPSHLPPRTLTDKLRFRKSIPPFEHKLSHVKTTADNLVDFDGADDPYRPMNWSPTKKWSTVIIFGSITAGATFNSAVFSSATEQVASEFGVSTIVVSLATTTILLGFATGPLLWGPLSEVLGRRWVMLIPYFLASIFAFGCGAATNIASILILRFFQGFFSSSVVTNAGGMLGDIFTPKERGTALIVYSLSVVGGPLISPIIGSAIATSYLGWRWIMYIVGILQIFLVTVAALTTDETFAPVLLQHKARKLRIRTGNWALHAKHEEWDVSLEAMAKKYLVRPFLLLLNPICFLISFYASFVFGCIYGSLEAIPIIFVEQRGWGPVVGSLPFLALLLGCVIGLLVNQFNQKIYARALASNNGKPVPEARLYPQMVGGFIFAAGIFIFAWTGPDDDIFWLVPCIGICLIGVGFFPVFQASFNYIIDTFLPVAASAVASFTFMRSCVAAAFPIFVPPMLSALGVSWGVSVVGWIAVALIPVPFLFFFFGRRLRALGTLSKETV